MKKAFASINLPEAIRVLRGLLADPFRSDNRMVCPDGFNDISTWVKTWPVREAASEGLKEIERKKRALAEHNREASTR